MLLVHEVLLNMLLSCFRHCFCHFRSPNSYFCSLSLDWGIYMKLHTIQVHTYSGYKADERPLMFIFEGKIHKIKGILHQAYEEIPGKRRRRRYTIKTDEKLTFKLLYDENQDRWFLEE